MHQILKARYRAAPDAERRGCEVAGRRSKGRGNEEERKIVGKGGYMGRRAIAGAEGTKFLTLKHRRRQRGPLGSLGPHHLRFTFLTTSSFIACLMAAGGKLVRGNASP